MPRYFKNMFRALNVDSRAAHEVIIGKQFICGESNPGFRFAFLYLLLRTSFMLVVVVIVLVVVVVAVSLETATENAEHINVYLSKLLGEDFQGSCRLISAFTKANN
jgi:hypothetical protein